MAPVANAVCLSTRPDMVSTPILLAIYYKPLFTLDRAPPLSKQPTLIYTLQYEQGTAAKLGRIFIPSDDTPLDTPKHRRTLAARLHNHPSGLCSKQHIKFPFGVGHSQLAAVPDSLGTGYIPG